MKRLYGQFVRHSCQSISSASAFLARRDSVLLETFGISSQDAGFHPKGPMEFGILGLSSLLYSSASAFV